MSTLVLFLKDSSVQITDARTVSLPNITLLAQYFQDYRYYYGSWEPYRIYESSTKLVPISQLHSYDAYGYLPTENQQNFSQILQDAWNSMEPSRFNISLEHFVFLCLTVFPVQTEICFSCECSVVWISSSSLVISILSFF